MKWSASLICADLFSLENDLKILQEFGVEFLHVDVMDGLFVPRLGMYPEMVQKVREVCSIPIEVHLMIENPEPYISVFQEAGASVITVHLEACQSNLVRTLEAIRRSGMQGGIALNPASDLDSIEYVKDLVDYLLIMGINPGIVGQKIKPFISDKIRRYRSLIDAERLGMKIIIDGGVNFENYQTLFDAGADFLVGGSQTIFHPKQALNKNLIQLKSVGAYS